MRSKLFLSILVIFAIGLPNPLSAQDTRGTISGTVVDASEAVVAGANVLLTKTETGVTVTGTTNDSGKFNIPFLTAGIYGVVVQKAGFKTYSQENIQLRISETVALTLHLEVGSVTEQVNVRAVTPLLDTATSTPGQVISELRVASLPLQGGDAFELVRQAPGVVNTQGLQQISAGSPKGTSQISADGSPAFTTQFQIDGIDDTVNDGNLGYSRVAYIPPTGAIDELKLQASPYDASVGHVLGPVLSASTKSGTNQFHGSIYYWLHTSALDATDHFTKVAGQSKPDYQYNRYGVTFGGPLTIPHVYDGRNKLFFFFAWEGDRNTNPSTSNQVSTVPTAAERAGDFSALLSHGSNYQIYNPFTTVSIGNGRYQRSPFLGNIIPANLLNSVGLKLASLYPLPNQTGASDGENNYFYPDVRHQPDDSFTGRLDYALSDNNRLFLRVNRFHFQITKNLLGIPASAYTQNQINQGGVLDDVWVLSPTLVLNLRYGLTAAQFPETRGTQGTDLTSFGFSSALESLLVNPTLSTVPQVQAGSFAVLSKGSSGDGTNTYLSNNLVADVTKQKGDHAIRFGVDARLLQSSGDRYPGANSPNFNFTTTYTRGPLDNSTAAPIGQELAEMLLGIPEGNMVSPAVSNYVLHNEYLGLYLQDDYQVTSKLTLNLGLRYEFETAPVEGDNRLNASFDSTDPNALTAQAQANFAKNPIPGVSSFSPVGGLTFVSQNGIGRSPYPSTNEFLPRVGLAWHVTPNSVVRSGYGVYFGSLGVSTFQPSQTGFNQTTPIQPSLNNGVSYVASLANPFPNGLTPPSGATGGLNTGFGQAISFFNPNMKPPYSQRWSFGFESVLPGQFLLDMSYVGNKVTHLGVTRSINNTPAQYLSTLPVRDQATINYLTATYANPLNGLSPLFGTTISRATALEPFPEYGAITSLASIGNSEYNSLQMRLEKRFSQGYTVLATYTYSKLMEETAFLNPTDTAPYRTISAMDAPNLFSVSGVWELPFGRGRHFLGALPRPLNAIIGDWRLAGSSTYQSGQPLPWGNILFAGNINDIPLPANKRSASEWFNVNAGFNTNSKQQLANNIRTFPLMLSNTRSQRLTNINLSLSRDYHILDRLGMQFRADMFNVLNHPVFAAPSTTPTSAAFGTITQDINSPRDFQFSWKLDF
jgi:hypothetical protein